MSCSYWEKSEAHLSVHTRGTKKVFVFLKRKTRFLHYSIEWKKSRGSVTDIHSQNPDTEGLGNGGSVKRFRSPEPNGETALAIFGLFSRGIAEHERKFRATRQADEGVRRSTNKVIATAKKAWA